MLRLTEVYKKHGGLRPQDVLPHAAIPPWERHLRGYFLSGLKPEIVEIIKSQCVVWWAARLDHIEACARHAENLISERAVKKAYGPKGYKERLLSQAAAGAWRHAGQGGPRQGNSRGRGRFNGVRRGRRGRGGGRRLLGDRKRVERERSGICYACGEEGH